jgi:hypothetical protein
VIDHSFNRRAVLKCTYKVVRISKVKLVADFSLDSPIVTLLEGLGVGVLSGRSREGYERE